MNGSHSAALIDEAQLDRWLAAARPGAELGYAMGWTPAAVGEAFNERLRRLASGGFLYLKQRRAEQGGGFVYIAERSSRPLSARPMDAAKGSQ